MLNKVIFDDEITLYWEKEWDLSDDTRYAILVNGERIAITDKTHFELRALNEDTEYSISLQRLGSADHIEETLFTGIIRTKKTRKRLDITKAPYFAVGDGKTLNTAVLQKAFDDCKEDECIYFPQGTYLTGALDVKSETEIYLCQGAILQGSTNIKDNTWNIHFENLNVTSGSVSATTPTISNGTNITYTVTLDKPGDYYEFSVDVKNAGSIDAMISGISNTGLTSEQKKYMTYSATYDSGVDIAEKQELKANSKERIRVTVRYRYDINNLYVDIHA